ncbi:MAG: DUF1295 domain-containing protein [Bacteroidota bacterium]
MSEQNKTNGLLWVTLAYILAFGLGLAGGYWSELQGHHPLVVVAIADLIGTIVIFIISFLTRNSSFYDPYWSVIPPAIAIYFAFLGAEQGADFWRIILLNSVIGFWAVRLTLNWVRSWDGIHHEDWRYIHLRNKTGVFYWLVSFSGIHLFPTIMVYLACLPMYPALAIAGEAFGWIDILAFVLGIIGVLFEWIGDEQLYRFRQSNPSGKSIKVGLWKYTRHPNYFGEITVWLSMLLFGMAANPSYYWTGVGYVAIWAMFRFITLPMMENRQLKRRPDYQEIRNTVSVLFPWFPKKG